MKRDFQRSRVYRSENEVELLSTIPQTLVAGRTVPGDRIESVQEIQAWINLITTSSWAKKTKHPDVHLSIAHRSIDGIVASYAQFARGTRVRDGRGRRSACARRNSRIISIPRFARSRIIILHELAHIICHDPPSHGPVFCRILLELVRRWMSIETCRQLRQEFKHNKVKVSNNKPPKEGGPTMAKSTISVRGKKGKSKKSPVPRNPVKVASSTIKRSKEQVANPARVLLDLLGGANKITQAQAQQFANNCGGLKVTQSGKQWIVSTADGSTAKDACLFVTSKQRSLVFFLFLQIYSRIVNGKLYRVRT